MCTRDRTKGMTECAKGQSQKEKELHSGRGKRTACRLLVSRRREPARREWNSIVRPSILRRQPKRESDEDGESQNSCCGRRSVRASSLGGIEWRGKEEVAADVEKRRRRSRPRVGGETRGNHVAGQGAPCRCKEGRGRGEVSPFTNAVRSR